MSVTNIYEYLVRECGDVLCLLTCDMLDGDLRAFSDYEKFCAVCRLSVRLSGNLRFKAINDALVSCFGKGARACSENCDSMWTGFYRSVLYGERQDVPCMQCEDELMLHIALTDGGYIDVGDMTEFVRPDLYHVNQARERVIEGCQISQREKNLLAVQKMREKAQETGRGYISVAVGGCKLSAVADAVEYIRKEFPHVGVLVLLDVDRIDKEAVKLACTDGVAMGVFIRQERIISDMRRAAGVLAIGNTVLVPRGCSAQDIEAAAGVLMSEWASAGVAWETCRAKSKILGNL